MSKTIGFNTRHVLALLGFSAMTAAVAAKTPELAKPGPPPWSAKSVKANEVPEVFYSQWYKAENSKSCALIMMTAARKEPIAKPRRADFAGGWAVAYDKPDSRSAFGIAGTASLSLSQNDAKIFPNLIRWSDGSYVSYGLEGGTGPGYLAYLTVAGQSCLYNIWSKQGKTHIEQLIASLRFADKPGK